MKYHSVSVEHTIGTEVGNRYAARTRRSQSLRRSSGATTRLPLEPSRKPRDAADLLAKIDSIYQELTLQPPPKARKLEPSPPPQETTRSTGLIFIGVLVVVLTLGEVWLYFDRHGVAKRPAPSDQPAVLAQTDSGRGAAAPAVVPAPAVLAPAPAASVAPEVVFESVHKARDREHRKAELRRTAEQEAARRAAEAEEQARQAREARLEASRRAELLAAAQAAQPKRPASPEELCADRSGFFSRNFCEARVCQQAEWANHPTCMQRRRDVERTLPGGG